VKQSAQRMQFENGHDNGGLESNRKFSHRPSPTNRILYMGVVSRVQEKREV